ncbi:hypothetical protein KO516_13575 [Citreicella sp. C3M06]|nr:hypothetical protein [Citreicella sp. C3M06]
MARRRFDDRGGVDCCVGAVPMPRQGRCNGAAGSAPGKHGGRYGPDSSFSGNAAAVIDVAERVGQGQGHSGRL